MSEQSPFDDTGIREFIGQLRLMAANLISLQTSAKPLLDLLDRPSEELAQLVPGLIGILPPAARSAEEVRELLSQVLEDHSRMAALLWAHLPADQTGLKS